MTQRNKVLLVSLLNHTDNLSVKYLHAALKKAGHSSYVLFFTSCGESYFKTIAEFVKEEGFSIVGISLMSPFLNSAARLTEAIREQCGKDTVIVWGGVHPTIDFQECRQYADYVCVGEAEKEFVDFVNQWSGRKFSGEARSLDPRYRSGLIECPVVDNLDDLPFPEHFPRSSYITHDNAVKEADIDLFKKYGRYRGTYLSVISTRGCPLNCSFCCNNVLSRITGRTIRKRSPESVIAEILWNLERSPIHFNYLNFVDDCFMVHSEEWLRKFVKAYSKIGIPISFRLIPRFITEEKINILKDAPCGFALIGLQSGSDRINEEIYLRKQSKEDLLKCSMLLSKHQIPAAYDVIMDNPYETSMDLEKTLDLIGSLPKTSCIFFFSLTFYKHTALYEKAKADGFDVDSHMTKFQGSYDRASKENRLIRVALFLPKSLVRKLHYDDTKLGNALLSILTVLAKMIFEPFRFLKLAYLSQQRKPGRFTKLLYYVSTGFFLKIFFTRKAGEA